MLTCVVVLAGGQSARLGRDKLSEPLTGPDGLSVLAHLLAGLDAGWPGLRVRLVGPARPESAGRERVREVPAGGGPVAALAAGLAGLADDALVAVVAGDQPFAASALGPLGEAIEPGVDGALALDGSGVRQPLLAVYRVGVLRAAIGASPAGRSVRSVLAGLRLAEVQVEPAAALDVDTEPDLERARARFEPGPPGCGPPPRPKPF